MCVCVCVSAAIAIPCRQTCKHESDEDSNDEQAGHVLRQGESGLESADVALYLTVDPPERSLTHLTLYEAAMVSTISHLARGDAFNHESMVAALCIALLTAFYFTKVDACFCSDCSVVL